MKLLTLSLVVLAACGNDNPDDPLTGEWRNATCDGSTTLPEGIMTCTTTLKFTADLKVSYVVTERAPPAAPTTPRCLTTREVTGQTWSTTGTVFKVAGTGTARQRTTDCVNSGDNRGETADPSVELPAGDYPYTISGNTLTVSSGAVQGMYTKVDSNGILP